MGEPGLIYENNNNELLIYSYFQKNDLYIYLQLEAVNTVKISTFFCL